MDLATRLLNHELLISQLLTVPLSVRRTTRSVHARQYQLKTDDVKALVERYQAGESTRELAADMPVHRHTITKALAAAGVELRHKRRRLTDDQVAVVAVEYTAGASLVELATRHGVGRETIRRELLEAGVPLRPRGRAT